MSLVNTDLLEAHELIVQAGVFGEHDFTTVEAIEAGQPTSTPAAARGRWVRVRLEPGAVVRLKFGMLRFENAPSYDTPWVRSADAVTLLKGRQD